jgi:hypothetical protein
VKVVVGFLLMFILPINIHSSVATALSQSSAKFQEYSDWDCSDFGTQERAQHEFNLNELDLYSLDEDDDGEACEANQRRGWWPFLVGGIGLVAGRQVGRKKRLGRSEVVTGIRGLYLKRVYVSEEDLASGISRPTEFDETPLLLFCLGGWTWFPMTLLRDSVLPIGTGQLTLLSLQALFAFIVTYWIAAKKAGRI